MNQSNKNTDVTRNFKRATALITAAAGAMALLLGANVAGGQDTTQPSTPPAASTRPTMVTDGLTQDGGIRMTAGRSMVLNLHRRYTKAAVGSTEIADWTPILNSDTSLIFTAHKPGGTGLILWDEQNHTQVIDVLVEPDLGAIRTQLKATFPDLKLEVIPLNDTIALRGQVPSVKESEQIVEMAGTYGKVHNFLEICGGQQVMLAVKFAEVSKTAEKDLGVNFGGTDGTTSIGNNIGQVSPLGFTQLANNRLGLGVPSPNGAISLFGTGGFGNTAFVYFINALRENGLVRVLAEPNLVAISGQQASFTAGGAFPVPVSQGGGSGAGAAVTVDYKEYGVRLNFTPLVLGDGRIRLKINPEVSDLDFANAVRSNGFLIPALTERKLETTVELADGQSFALAGLLNQNQAATADSIPLLGDIPVLGQLFRSTKYKRNETELVILVTPRLTAAMNPDKVPALPGEHWRYPNEAQLFIGHDLGGEKIEVKPAATDRTGTPPPMFHGAYGFTSTGAGAMRPAAGK